MTVDSASQQALHTFYSDHHGWLKGWLRRRLGCSEQAADLAHDTFLRMLLRGQLPSLQEPRAFLVTTAKRLLIDRGRREAIERACLAELAQIAETQPAHPAPEQICATLEILMCVAVAMCDWAQRGSGSCRRCGDGSANLIDSDGLQRRLLIIKMRVIRI